MKAWRSAVWVSAALSAVAFFCGRAGPPRSFGSGALDESVHPARRPRGVSGPRFLVEANRLSNNFDVVAREAAGGDSRTCGTNPGEDCRIPLEYPAGNLFRLLGGASSAGSIAVSGLVAALLVWSIWRIAPVVIRWLSGAHSHHATTRRNRLATAAPEAADLYEQAGHAAAKRSVC